MIKKRMHNNLLFGLLLFVLCSLFSVSDVFAADSACDSVGTKYENLRATVNSSNSRVVTISSKKIDDKKLVNKNKKNIEFVLTGVSFDFSVSEEKKSSSYDEYIRNIKGNSYININNMTIVGKGSIKLDLTTLPEYNSKYSSDPKKAYALLRFTIKNDDCGDFEYNLLVEGIGRTSTVQELPGIPESTSVFSKPIDCTKAETSFDIAFCKVKNYASSGSGRKNLSAYYDNLKDGDVPKALLKCDYNVTASDIEENLEDSDCYYKNIKYLYGKKTNTINVGTYTYHLNPNGSPVTKSVSCERTCEEAVEVRYGPPVASKAGMCFEYKVKVVSRVNCYSNTKITTGDNYRLCTPTPQCTSSSGTIYRQGGPNEDFDLCVNRCDGGKYTKKCSNKCYKEVYGTSNKLNNNLSINYATKLDLDDNGDVSQGVKDCADGSGYDGCYYMKGGYTYWYGKGVNKSVGSATGYQNSLNYAPGRWYIENEWGWGITPTYHVYSRNGIYKAPDCGDYCKWTNNCGTRTYLNRYNYEKDYTDNLAVYNSAIEKCKALASCSESTAEFTIEADYKNGKNNTTIHFPYTENNPKNTYDKNGYATSIVNSDKIESTKDGFKSKIEFSSGNSVFRDDGFDCKYPGSCTGCTGSNCKPDTNCDLIKYKGCYDKGTDKTDRYRATWSFPGSWINLKTGEVSFQDFSKSKAWLTFKHKFCIPLNAEDVNTSWWNYYYANKAKSITLSIDDSKIKNYCSGEDLYKNSTKLPKNNEITWNIRANTTKFGYMKWDINIKCFYAINSNNATTITTGKTTNKDKCTVCENDTCYRIRSVDLNNLFPETDGKSSSKDSAGRTPGFNWSTYANTNNGKNNDKYLSVPSALIKKIQNKGNAVYSDEYLDYEFYLSPTTLKSMRKTVQGSGDNYTDFDISGFSVDKNGVGRYVSSRIRDLKGSKKIPDKSSNAINCNNMKNYSSNECEVVVNE